MRLSDVEQVFYVPFAVSNEDSQAIGEQVFITIGKDGFDRVLVVVYSISEEDIRIISGGKATRNEADIYEKGMRFFKKENAALS
jgi:uncharacterized DUF497 family protein